ncbi:vacuolar protein sorting-associated protein 51 homolog [Planococcus citri]|uniref:vacuolar protein sorting-associated protein 51 homolog n=1 Tax=Planococcus citri TaxID=170843 RepID=UPI0031F7A8A3
MMDNSSCYNINDPNFNVDLYYKKLLKECSLKQLMDKENEIVRAASTLHSDMQTLVYENYNKFISATETIKKMKTDFKKMENEMELLTTNMNSITSFSDQISSTLQGTRKQVSDLCSKHDMLKRLQFLFKLPNQLKNQVQENNFRKAVEDYKQAQQVLIQYGDLDSFRGIREDCDKTVIELRTKLHRKLTSSDVSTKELTNCVQLLMELDEPIEDLSSEFLEQANIRLKKHLDDLGQFSDCQDMLEFVDSGSSGFLNELCITVATYNDLFLKNCSFEDISKILTTKCDDVVAENMDQYFVVIQNRIESEKEADDSAIIVKALDKFCRKLQTANVLTPHSNFASAGTEIVIKAARRQCRLHLNALKIYFSESIANVKQTLATSKSLLAPNVKTESNSSSERTYESLFSEFLTCLVTNVIEKIKGILQDLMVFLQPELLFSSKNNFRESFCVDSVREGLVVSFLHHLIATINSFTETAIPQQLLFILSKVSLQYHSQAIHSLLDLVDKWFHIDEFYKTVQLSTETELCTEMYAVAQRLINHFVKMQGLSISQMLRKSVETRDWLHGMEPRMVRPVMKRVIEELTNTDAQVGVLFEEGAKADRSSDSSRKTQSRHHRSISNWSSYTPASTHSINVINKLFSERIDIFAPVQFSKVSIMTGIIKISLKTLLECVRLKTFSRYGLQQVQVDTHYLQLYLWRFLHDENLINFLLDDILGSAVQRCLDPVLMEPSVIEIICERG